MFHFYRIIVDSAMRMLVTDRSESQFSLLNGLETNNNSDLADYTSGFV